MASNRLLTIGLLLARWLDDVALGLSRALSAIVRKRVVQLVEQAGGEFVVRTFRRGVARGGDISMRIEDGAFIGPTPDRTRALLAGRQVDVVLAPSRFIFQRLELPRQASPFLEGVVRSQLDRLTPWSAGDAAFGWSAPSYMGLDRIVVTVAATARDRIASIEQALGSTRAASIRLSTHAEGASAPIEVFARRSMEALRKPRLRTGLIAGLGLAGVVLAATIGAAIVVGGDLDARATALQHQIAQRRAALLSGRGSAGDETLAGLDAKKRATPSAIIVMESLSKALPDDAYLSELRIEDGKVQLAGVTRDAPALIGLIEQSKHFTHATFFAPTTRTPTQNGDNFHIEAHIEPSFPVTN
jgi:general secretion pathway protein L